MKFKITLTTNSFSKQGQKLIPLVVASLLFGILFGIDTPFVGMFIKMLLMS